MKTLYSNSEKDTEKIAFDLAKQVPFGSVICLSGNLGAGKTVFARGFARGLGIKDIISSPTFNIVKEYEAPNDKWMYHLDLYRINDSDSAIAFGIDEYINDNNAVVLIEWSERIEDILESGRIIVNINRTDKGKRQIKIAQESL
ncbi:MAG: tRNA (adenosine(37)-N6)-threonylcarbamoyltransferase complex ATPase subunit type 1 TsaE [bacterium]|nr:tRNA (adenosine(37)-N6)-threonylcarbamoyltransferase complex ATPase subunit type 1 TsaE [bacterium]